MRRTPLHIPYYRVTPITTTPASARAPLTRHATEAELRSRTAVDPIVGDTITCAELRDRDRECWRECDSRWPRRQAYKLDDVERERASTTQGICRRRRWVLLRMCRVDAVRAG